MSKYWDNITYIAKKQERKGVREYGQKLEDNKALPTEVRITMLEEELVDALMYLEHLKADVYDAESIEELIAKTRADAIDGMVDTLIDPKNYERYDFDDCLSDSNKANDFFSYVFAIAEQLKEVKK